MDLTREHAALLLVGSLFVTTGATAKDGAKATSDAKPTDTPLPNDEKKESESGHLAERHTLAEFELGMIALPDAPISPGQKSSLSPLGSGDATIETGLHLVFRGDRNWAVGAGFLFGPRPSSERLYGGLTNLVRTHTRAYLTVTTEGRYIPLHLKRIEGWIGLSTGVVVIADRFITEDGENHPVPTFLGTREVTIRTEGFTLGLEAGLSWNFYEQWVAGVRFRGARWMLPSEPSCVTIGDCATLSGSVAVFELGLSVGYRLALF